MKNVLEILDESSEEELEEIGRYLRRRGIGMGLPYEIQKASTDPFMYGIRLKTGLVFYFEELDIVEGGWARLKRISAVSELPRMRVLPGQDAPRQENMNFERGLLIRLSEISWIADAPFGS